jgi:hypothetical protein
MEIVQECKKLLKLPPPPSINHHLNVALLYY